MHVYSGTHVVFLCLVSRGPYDPAVMRYFLSRLDAGWKKALQIVSCPSPAPRSPAHTVAGSAALVAAVPDSALTCGYGCGYSGMGGVEVAGFYDHDYPSMVRESQTSDLRSFSHYYFYEFGRNFCVFGSKHSAFGTGFAVLLRYSLMDILGASDHDDPCVRSSIERCEELYAENPTGYGYTFVEAMARASTADEKQDRIPALVPSDQPCMYASAQLRLQRQYGGEMWLQRFFSALNAVPDLPEDVATPEMQCEIWLFCASAAAGRLLEDEFVGRWRLELPDERLTTLRALEWTAGPEVCMAECLSRGLIPKT